MVTGFRKRSCLNHPRAEYPPSTGNAVPVTKSDAEPHKNTAAPAMSFDSPHRPAGVRDRTKSWFFTALYREFLNRHRHEVRFPKVELHDAPEEAVSIMPNMDAFDGASITKALREVEEPFRAALTLFYLEQFSYQEIADVWWQLFPTPKTNG